MVHHGCENQCNNICVRHRYKKRGARWGDSSWICSIVIDIAFLFAILLWLCARCRNVTVTSCTRAHFSLSDRNSEEHYCSSLETNEEYWFDSWESSMQEKFPWHRFLAVLIRLWHLLICELSTCYGSHHGRFSPELARQLSDFVVESTIELYGSKRHYNQESLWRCITPTLFCVCYMVSM